MMTCAEEDAEYIEEQVSNAFNATARPEEGAEEEEFV